jgi:prophage antirepressor-like protein
MVKKGIVMDISDEEYNSVVISYGHQIIGGNRKVKLQSEESKAKNGVKDAKQNENLQESNVVGHLLSYKGNNISTFVDSSGETWWKSSDIMKILGYKDYDKVVRKNVSSENKNTLGYFKKICPSKLAGQEFLHIDKNAIYVNTSGFFELLDGSGKKEAKEFKHWVNNVVLPTINKTGKYELYEKKKLVINNVDGFVSWYDNNDELSLKDKNSVFYIGIIGKMENVSDHDSQSNIQDGEVIMKYGISSVDETKRFLHHKQTVGSYMCVHVTSVFRNKLLENDVKAFLSRKHALRDIRFGNEHYKELFALSDTLSLQDVILYVEKWCEKNDYKHDTENSLEMERIKLKQIEMTYTIEQEKTKQLELLTALLNNSNLEQIDKINVFLQNQKIT